MADEPDFTTLKDQYAARVTADLEANQQDQARIRAELDTLKGQLEALERDYGLLQTMQHTLVSTAGAAAQASAAAETAKGTRKRTTKAQPTTKAQSTAKAPAPAAASASSSAATPTAAAVPKPRKARAQKPEAKEVEEATKTKTAKAAKGAKTAPSPKKAAARPRKSASKGAESSGPTLREVVLGLFAGHQEPRTVADILTELTTAHPDRKTSPQVVRNTLEALVAKGELERERKQGSVFYTAGRTSAPAEKSEEKAEAPTAAPEAVDAPATASASAPAAATA
ncbi:hypothetical protein AB0M57_18040 [Streptomyces sp. NPDC051597]|uniref:hypothetical protein n=1 Tax=Streptomyces sp. NPDC051597 TaxID=3155049 RepID=UPI0034289E51